eukprot:2824889-Lingulodinium_polyedra.AAC.1
MDERWPTMRSIIFPVARARPSTRPRVWHARRSLPCVVRAACPTPSTATPRSSPVGGASMSSRVARPRLPSRRRASSLP